MGRLTSHPKSSKTSRCVVLVRNGETVAEDEYDEEAVPTRSKKRRRKVMKKQDEQQHQDEDKVVVNEEEEDDPETKVVRKRIRKGKTASSEQTTIVRRSQRRAGQGLNEQVLDFETEVRWEEQELFDCCFIKVTGKVYNRWKELKSKLQFTRDEELVVYLMDKQKEFAKRERSSSTPLPTSNSGMLNVSKNIEIKEEDVDDECSNTDKSNSKSYQKKISGDEPDEDRDLLSIRNEKRLKKLHDEVLTTDEMSENEDEDDFRKLEDGKLCVIDSHRISLDNIYNGAETDSRDESQSPLHLSSQLDETWCRHCDKRHLGGRIVGCPLQNPIQIVSDAVIDFSSSSRSNTSVSNREVSKSFAQLSIPNILELVPIPDENSDSSILVVVTKTRIPAHTQFGPLQGELILERNIPEDSSMKDFWLVFTKDLSRVFISTTDPEKSNWFKYVRPASSRRQRNVASLVKNDQLHLVTLRDLEPGEEIVYWIDDPILIWNKSKADKKSCLGCNLRFDHPLHYRMHCVVFHDPQFSMSIRKYHCKICGAAVLGKENIVKHAANQHGGKGAYQCLFCKKFFLRPNYLEMHRQYGCSSNPTRPRSICNICGKKFGQPLKLKVHLRRIHGEDCEDFMEDFKCPLCDKMLPSHHAAIRHQRDIHPESFDNFQEYDLDEPEMNHIDEPRRFTNSHNQIAKVPCPKCPKMFKNKSNLKIHMLTHSGVKPFGCKIEGCQSGFTTKQCLQFHYRKSHGLTDEEMPKIQREIPYTLSAYSGELMDNIGECNPNKRNKTDRMSRSSSSTECLRRVSQIDLPMTRSGSSTSFGCHENVGYIDKDIYEFQDEETSASLQSLDSAKKEMDLLNVTDKTSLLVVAALCAAEHDLKASAAAASASNISDDSENEGKSHYDEIAEKISEHYSSPEHGVKADLGLKLSSADLVGLNHPEIQEKQEIRYNPDLESMQRTPVGQSTSSHLESTPMSDHLSSEPAVYDGFLSAPAQSSFRRSPTGPYSTPNAFPGSSSSHIHSTSTREATGNYVQHYPFTHSSARSYPGLDLSSRYSSTYRNQGEFASTSPLPYGRGNTPYTHQQPHPTHPQSEYTHHPTATDIYYSIPDSNSGSIDLSAHGSVSNSSSTASSSGSLFNHHNSMVMRNDHQNCRGDTPPPDVLGHFSRAKESLDVMLYHGHSHQHAYYPHPQVSNHPTRYAPSPSSYHHPPTTPRLPHLGQSTPYHYGYF